MDKVVIVTDSAAELTLEEREELGVLAVPVRVQVGRKIYKDGVNINVRQYLNLVRNVKQLPRLFPPTEDDFYNVYSQAVKRGKYVVSIHMSRRLVNMEHLISVAAGPFLGRLHVAYVDTRSISRGQAELVRYAAGMAADGATLGEIVKAVHNMVPHVYQYYYTTALDYMERDKLISPAQAILGRLLEIKPFLLLEEGVMVPLEKVITMEQVLDKIYQFVVEFSRFEKVFIQHQGMEEETEAIVRMLENYPRIKGKELKVETYGIPLATYIGPMALGVTVCEGMEPELF